MRLARYRDADGVAAGVVDGDHIVPFLAEADATGSAEAALLVVAMGRQVPTAVGDPVALDDVALLAPVGSPPSIRDFYAFEGHVATARRARGQEMDADWYELPVFYFSNPAAVVDPGAPVAVSPGCVAFDYELEVAAVVGREARSPGEDSWLDVVAGFCVMNDWSARDLQMREMAQGLGPAKGKDGATSLGPLLVTPDELPDLESGRPRGAMVARVNGRECSRGELADIGHPWGALVAHAGRGTVLRPGDVLGSGTVGTGCLLERQLTDGADAFPWLVPGDVVELEVEGLGILANPVVADPGVQGGAGRTS